ncbi:hypothetical protein E1B28_009862 [Marasmius oreades]|uniref:Uncharacterized protein n=1 Tax=Marasmius oreades TaxID=181124 RepID=A0A9P7RW30_9AGAR|nr:uncharacterized protein E1B28_009862 [Marasmius oreades]KAG7090777.1 hypothetical protein E1B28_009862 [Marasmius oreades]
MFQHNNPSLSSITSEELQWLDADAQILQDSSFLITEPSSTNVHYPCPWSSASNDSLLIARTKGIPPRHHYQRSTKSSSAKTVTPIHNHSNRLSNSLALKRPNHPNLHSTATPTPLSTPSLSNSSLPSLSNHSDITSSVDSISAPRSMKRSHSPTATPPRSPEWIYRRPKSPTTPPASSRYRRQPEMNGNAGEPSATSQGSISYFSEISSSSSSLPSPIISCSEALESPTLWTSLLRPRKRSGSVTSKSSVNTSDIPSLWFSADDGAGRTRPSPGSRFSKAKKPQASSLFTQSPSSLSRSPSQLSVGSLVSQHGIGVQRNRSSSVSSSLSSISTSPTTTSSSLPSTPSSPSLSPSLTKKFKPHHQCIVEDVEPESEPEDKLGLEQSLSIRRKEPLERSASDPMSSTPVLSQSLYSPKRRLKPDTSSNKSVKFAETPTVHYASAGYDPDFWHVPGESLDTDVEVDTDQMDIENENVTSHVPTIPDPYAYARTSHRMDVDEEPTRIRLRDYRPEDRETLVTPTPDRVRGLKSAVSKSLKRHPSSGSSWRSAPKLSPSRSITPRPPISGPFVLGSTPTVPHGPQGGTPCTPRSQPRSKLVVSGIALRSAPSLESFKSVKSNTRSVRSLRSLKSLPESVKSSIELGAREMKEWFKGRISIGVGAL